MKKGIVIFLSCVFLLPLFSKTTKKDKKGLAFESVVYDYGKIKKRSKGECSFAFKNVDIVPVVISNVKTSCGCTSPKWPKEPIAPGESSEIVVKYNTNTIGPFVKTITVITSAGQNIILTIKGEVVKK